MMNAALESRAYYENEGRERAEAKRYELFLDTDRVVDVIECELAETEDAEIRECYAQQQAAFFRAADVLDALASGVPVQALSAHNVAMFRRIVHLSRCTRSQFAPAINDEFQQQEGAEHG